MRTSVSSKCFFQFFFWVVPAILCNKTMWNNIWQRGVRFWSGGRYIAWEIMYVVMTYSYSREQRTIGILSYADGDLLVSGLVVLTSGTSVPIFSFIPLLPLRSTDFRGFRTVVLCLRRAYRASALNEEDFSQKYALAIRSSQQTRPHTFGSISSGSFLPYACLVFFSYLRQI